MLNGKTLKIVTQDGPTLEYKFAANRRLTLSEAGKQVSAGYGEMPLNQMVFFSHVIPGEQTGYNVFVGVPFETETSLAAMARLHGEAVRTWWEGGVYRVDYKKDAAGLWKIRRLEYDTLSRADYRTRARAMRCRFP